MLRSEKHGPLVHAATTFLIALFAVGVRSADAAPPSTPLDDLDRTLAVIEKERVRATAQAQARVSEFAGPATDAMGVLTYSERFVRLIAAQDMEAALALKARAALTKVEPPSLEQSPYLTTIT